MNRLKTKRRAICEGCSAFIPEEGVRPAAIPEIPAALEYFDRLPNDAFVKQPVLEALFDCSGPTVWRRISAGKLPPAIKLSGNSNGWHVGTLRKVIQERVAAASHVTGTTRLTAARLAKLKAQNQKKIGDAAEGEPGTIPSTAAANNSGAA